MNHDQIFEEMSRNYFYIHTSVKESFSLSLLEAKLCGLVTVAYNKLEVPNEFIDLKISDFKINSWLSKILNESKIKKEKININKYLINNSTKKILNEIKTFDQENNNFLSSLNDVLLNKTKKKFNLPKKYILNFCYSLSKNNFSCY